MFRLTLLLCLIHFCLGGSISKFLPPNNGGKIVGGTLADIKDFPYQLSLQHFDFHICGASIISDTWAVTAAHCVHGRNPSKISLRAGTSTKEKDGSLHNAIEVFIHELYDKEPNDYDIAVIKVSTPFSFGEGVEPIDLPDQGDSLTPGTPCVVSGWGHTAENEPASEHLRQVEVPVISTEECNSYYFDLITEHMMCAGYSEGGKDACQGDSGGPLVSGKKLVGVVSWGWGCAQPNTPGVYTKVSSVRDWIKEKSGV